MTTEQIEAKGEALSALPLVQLEGAIYEAREEGFTTLGELKAP